MAGTEVASGYVKVSSKPDKRFKSNIENAMPSGTKVGKAFVAGFKGPVSGLASWFKGGAVMGAVSSVTTAAMGAISASMDSAVKRADTLANFPRVMTSMGYSAEAAAKSSDIMKAAIDGLPTKLQDITGNVQMLTSSMRNLSDGEVNATTVGKAFNDMMLAGGKGTEIANEAFNQLSKVIATGKVEMDSWMSIYTASPGTIDKVAESLLGAGKGGMDLKDALTSGKVKMDDFLATMVRLDKEGGEGFASFEQQAREATKGIETSANNAKNAISNQMANILGKLNANGEIAGIFDGIKATINNAGSFIVASIDSIKGTIDFEGFAAAFDGMGQVVSAAFGAGGMSAQDFGTMVGNAINSLIPVIQMATPLVGLLADAFAFLAQNAGVAVPVIGAVAIGMLAVKGASSVVGIMRGFSGALVDVGKSTKVFDVNAKTTSLRLAEMAKPLMQAGVAALALGGGIALAGAGMLMLANGAVLIANAGPGAAVAMVAMVGAIAGLAIGAAAIGPALTAGAVGMVAFGAAVALVGAGVWLASAGLVMVAGTLPAVATYGMAAGTAAMVLGAALMVMGAGALVAGAGITVLGAGLLVAAPGLLIASAAVMILGAGMLMVGAGATMAAPAILIMGTALPAIAASAAPAAAGLGLLAGAALAAVPGFAAGAGPAAALSAAIVPMGAAAMMAATGLMMVCVSLPVIASQAPAAGTGMQAFASATTSAVPALSAAAPVMLGMASAVQTMASGTLVGAASMAALAGGTQTASAGMSALDASMQSVSATASVAFLGIASSATASFSAASDAAQRACASIRTSIASLPKSTTVRVNVAAGSVKLPHFSMSGSFNAQTGSVPTVGVRWFKAGAIFKKPVFGMGEAGAEVSMPLYGRYMRPFAAALAGEMDSGGGTVNNVNVVLDYSASDDANDITRGIARAFRLEGLMR